MTIHADAEKLQEVDALYGSQGDRMAQLHGKYSPEEFAVITDFLEQTTVALDAEARALKKSAKNATQLQHVGFD